MTPVVSRAMRTIGVRGLRRLSRPFSAILLFGAAGMVVVIVTFAVGPRGGSEGRAPSIAPLPTATSSPAPSPTPTPASSCSPAPAHGKHGGGKAPADGACAPVATPAGGGDGGDGG